MITLQVGRVLHGTAAEGPGIRTAIWVQGCSIRCAGCINPHLFETTGGSAVDPRRVVEGALCANVEGITLLGGEPFDQPIPAGQLASLAQASGLGVITFTGYQHEELRRRPEAEALLQETDLLVDGPYRLHEPEYRRSLVGSANQGFINLTNRYSGFDPAAHRNRIDVRVSAAGEIRVAGFASATELRRLLSRG